MATDSTDVKKEDHSNAAIENFLDEGNSQFIKFNEAGDPIEGIYLGCRMEDDNFNPGQSRMVYDLEIDKANKSLSSGSKRLAKAFLKANPAVGNFVRITRIGEGFDTNYTVEADDMPF